MDNNAWSPGKTYKLSDFDCKKDKDKFSDIMIVGTKPIAGTQLDSVTKPINNDWNPSQQLDFLSLPSDWNSSFLTNPLNGINQKTDRPMPPSAEETEEEKAYKQSILEEAHKIVYDGCRRENYGGPVESFKAISKIASVLSHKDLTPDDCVNVMFAIKLSRESSHHKRDNLVDLCGYAAIKEELHEDEERNHNKK